MSRPIPRRDAFLLIAAAVADGMPVPNSVKVNESSVDVEGATHNDASRWLAWFGGDLSTVTANLNEHNPGKPFRSFRHDAPCWRGRFVYVAAYEDVQAPISAASKAADKVRAAAAQIPNVREVSDVAA